MLRIPLGGGHSRELRVQERLSCPPLGRLAHSCLRGLVFLSQAPTYKKGKKKKKSDPIQKQASGYSAFYNGTFLVSTFLYSKGKGFFAPLEVVFTCYLRCDETDMPHTVRERVKRKHILRTLFCPHPITFLSMRVPAPSIMDPNLYSIRNADSIIVLNLHLGWNRANIYLYS